MQFFWGSMSSEISTSNMANANLKWERTKSFNLGLDIGMFNGRLFATLDAYKQSTDDLLLNRSLPVIVGFDDIMANLGQVDNHGFELELRRRRKNYFTGGFIIHKL